jgi:amidase
VTFVDSYPNYDAVGLAELIRAREVSADEVIDAALTWIERLNPTLNAVVRLCEEVARAQARDLPDGPLAGAPILLKDEYQFVVGVPTSFASRLAAPGIVLQTETELVRRWRRAGVLILGKSNLPEFGASVATEPLANGVTRNPWDLTRGVGGSSGGSGCAVASRMVPLGYANDGAGSIRIPASANGLFGLKPTRARVPCGPLVSELWNGLVIEHVLTRSVRDSAAMLDATHGADGGAPYVAPEPARPYLDELGRAPGRLRIAVSTRPPNFDVPVDAVCVEAVEKAAALCRDLGHEVVEDTPPFEGEAVGAAIGKLLAVHLAYGIADLEAQGRKAGPDNVEAAHWDLSRWGASLPATELLAILDLFAQQSRACAPFFQRYDAWLTPTLASLPPPHGTISTNAEDEHEYLRRFFGFVPFTPIANVTGNPAMSLPLHWTAAGMPVGAHFVGRFGDEGTLFRLAAQLEAACPWADRRPSLSLA